jgi:hypothetical protein
MAKGFDGCNWFGLNGTIDDQRMVVDSFESTAIGCQIATLVPANGERINLDPQHTMFTLTAASSPTARLTYQRTDSLGAVPDPGELAGTWQLGSDAARLTLGADGSVVIGTCTGSWHLDTDGWSVTDLPADPSTCITPSAVLERVIESVTNGPMTIVIDASGVVWSTGPGLVFLLTPVHGS